MLFERSPALPGHNGAAWWFVFRGDDLLVGAEAAIPRLQGLREIGVPAGSDHVVGSLDGAPVRVAAVDPGAEAPRGMEFRGLRELFPLIGEDLFRVAGSAKQILTWDRDHRYCGRCGASMGTKADERAKVCPRCGHLSFPRLSPAMITAVVRDDRILLARARRFPPGLFSVLAGFVEPGETLEECVVREVREEVGIEVGDVTYFGSQSWPFPHSMMVAFTARYAGGEISIDRSEIREAAWFRAGELPEIPSRASISRRLIDWFSAADGGT